MALPALAVMRRSEQPFDLLLIGLGRFVCEKRLHFGHRWRQPDEIEIETAQQALSDVESHIRGMSVPAQDRIWWRFRQEQALLGQLLNFDLALVRSSEQVYQYVAQLTPDDWNSQGSAPLRRLVQQLTQIARDRERFLLLPM